jgi:hypothetical protein
MAQFVQDLAANQRIIALTWRRVQLSLLVVGLSILSLAMGMYHRPFPPSGALTGMIILISGYQLRLAQGQFGRLSPTHPRAWLQPLAYAFFVGGAVSLTLGLLAAVLANTCCT